MYIVYSKPMCTFCEQSKSLLKSKNLPFVEKMFDIGQERKDGIEYVNIQEFKAQYPNAKAAPQIFFEDPISKSIKHIGGFPELRASLI